MPARKIFVLGNDGNWLEFLSEAFEDTLSLPEAVGNGPAAFSLTLRQNPDVVFLDSGLISQKLTTGLKILQASNPNFRIFGLGHAPKKSPSLPYDEFFETVPTLDDFQKRLSRRLPLPNPLRLIIVDDEKEIGDSYRDYFEHRTDPSFCVEIARDGVEGERLIRQTPPHVLILDIKMPKKDGRELYRDLKKEGKLPPTIIFFDIVSAEEVIQIRRMGSPAFVEKGSAASALPEMTALIKKIAYFG